MKKYCILFLALLILLCGCGQEEELPAPTGEQVQANQTTPEETGPEAIVDPEDITEPPATEIAWRVVRNSVKNEDGEEILYMEYAYDEYGRLTELWEFDGEGNLTSFSSTSYLSDTEYETTYETGESKYSVRFTCDEDGNVLLQERTEDGVLTTSTSYTYDSYGNMLTTIMVYEDGSQIELSYEYAYDADGNPVTVHEYNGGEPAGWRDVTFDGQGRQTKAVYYSPSDELMRSIVTTWEDNTQTDISYDAEGRAYLTRIIIYDVFGNVISQETRQEDVMISLAEFTYEQIDIIAN